MPSERWLITGAYGCVGAWVVRELLAEGNEVVTFDLSDDPRRLRLLLEPGVVAAIPHVTGDITELDTLRRTLDEHAISAVIHLAALQIPLCRADPPLGARVNVVGTVNVFEAVKERRDRISHVVYASSVAAFDGPTETMSSHPATLYGAFKRANESTATVYWQDERVPSIGLRPHTIFGVGRDVGLTSAPTTAMLAAAAGTPYTIPFGGRIQLQFAQDIARAFIACSNVRVQEAQVHNPPGWTMALEEVVETICAVEPSSRGTIRCEQTQLPFPAYIDSRSFADIAPRFVLTPFEDAVRETVEHLRQLLARGLVTAPGAPA